MFAKFLPRSTEFFDFFEQHASITKEAARIFHSSITEQGNDLKSLDQIKDLEHKADEIIHQCIEELHKCFITPIEREDIHQLIDKMDDIIDNIDKASDCLKIYKISSSTSELKNLSNVLLKAVEEVSEAVTALPDMKNIDVLRLHCAKIHKLEHEAEALLRNALGKLFDEVQDLRLLIKLKEIYETLETATHRCEEVANIIEGVILEYY